MYADRISGAMRAAIDETERRRTIQKAYNEEHGITPQSIRKSVRDVIEATKPVEDIEIRKPVEMTRGEITEYVKKLEKEMKQAAADWQFERAAQLRDIIFEYKARL